MKLRSENCRLLDVHVYDYTEAPWRMDSLALEVRGTIRRRIRRCPSGVNRAGVGGALGDSGLLGVFVCECRSQIWKWHGGGRSHS